MTAPVWQDRLVESISLAFDAAWSGGLVADTSDGSFTFTDTEQAQLDTELQFIALADLILPFAAAGLLNESDTVGGLPSPSAIRRYVDDNGLADRYMSAGCQMARLDWNSDRSVGEEIRREWSTWLTYCMHAHSSALRGTLPVLFKARDAVGDLLIAPRRRIERVGPDGERLVSVVPRRAEDPLEAERIEPLLDQCEIVAAHADSFRIIGPLFSELVSALATIHPYSSADYDLSFPFIAYLWPFSPESFRAVVEICDGIERLAESLNVEIEEEREREPARLR
jgi:hypothetical protein